MQQHGLLKMHGVMPGEAANSMHGEDSARSPAGLPTIAQSPDVPPRAGERHLPRSRRLTAATVCIAWTIGLLQPVLQRMVELLLRLILPVAMLLPFHAHAEEDYLPPEEAFRLSAKMVDAQSVAITYAIADGYYMYRERFAFAADKATLGAPVIPPGKVKFDETFQKNVETYRHAVTITVPVTASGPFTLSATGQGCADKGLCYPPMTSTLTLSPTAIGQTVGAAAAGDAPQESASSVAGDAGRIDASLRSGRLLAIVPLFFLLGLGLSLTPCVLPMLPILSSIILGANARDGQDAIRNDRVARRRGLWLSVAYSLGMATVYTALGIGAGLAGEGLQANLQHPALLTAFALLMVALSLSMFGFYALQMPASIQTRLNQASDKRRGGGMTGVFVMGALSALIVGPCVAAPLAGALVYLSQTRNVVIGGSALFAMAAGMSVPLLLIGASAGTLLPRAGAWMESIKRFFGVLMLGVALWMIAPVIPAWAQLAGWAALGVGYGAYLLWRPGSGWQARALGLLFAAAGLAQAVGLATGGRDPLAPLAHLGGGAVQPVQFQRVRSVAELDAALAQARAAGKVAMLDFYADWCVSCKEMEKLTFTEPAVRSRLERMVLLQADVTANNADDKALLKRFRLFGPPGIILFDRQGGERADLRVIGYEPPARFQTVLDGATK